MSALASLRPPACSLASVLVHMFGARPFYRTSSGELRTLCPWHLDSVPSLWVNDDRGLYCCMACGAGGSVMTVVEPHAGSRDAARRWLRDVAPTLPPVETSRAVPYARGAGRSRSAARTLVDVHPYWGMVYADYRFEKHRYDPKDFRIYHRDSDGRLVPGMGGRAGVLFAMPLLAEARASDMAVLEGEKDVLRAWEVGIPATCNPEGAGRWREAYSWSLVGLGVKRVFAIPDNDPPGKAHAAMVVAACRGVGVQAYNVGVLPGVGPKGDLSDFLDAGHTAGDVRALMTAARRKRRA